MSPGGRSGSVVRGYGGKVSGLPAYLEEAAFRYNNRDDEVPMLQTMLGLVSR
jgi:hypothetical protein